VGQAVKASDRIESHKGTVAALAGQYYGNTVQGEFNRLLNIALMDRQTMPKQSAPPNMMCGGPAFYEQRIPVSGEFSDIFFKLGLLETDGGIQYAKAPASMMAAKLLLLPTIVSACYRANGKESSVSISQLPLALRENASDVVGVGEQILVSVKPIVYNRGVLKVLSDFTKSVSVLEAPFCEKGFTDTCLALSVFSLSNVDAGTILTRGGPLGEQGITGALAKSFVSLLQEEPEMALGSRKVVLDVFYNGELGWVSDKRVKVSATNVRGELGKIAMVSMGGAVYCARETQPVSYTVYSEQTGGVLSGVFSGSWKNALPVG
jgi:hypothetical protein